MTYNWTTFNLDDALAGTLVGFEQMDGSTPIDYDLSKTGILKGPGPFYKVVISGIVVKCDKDGNVLETTPHSNWEPVVSGQGEQQTTTYTTLQMVTTDMGDTSAVGGTTTRSGGSGSDPEHSSTVTLTSMEARDHFAVNILKAMLEKQPNPETFDDANCLYFARAAYRWAQAMMIVAGDARTGDSTGGGSSQAINVESGDLQSNSEKLLYNKTEYMKKGIAIVGPTVALGDPTPKAVQTQSEVAYKAKSVIPNTINIIYTIYKTKHIRMEFANPYMAYSDISVVFELAVKEGTTDTTRKISYIIPKGTVIVIEDLDSDVTEIVSVTSATVRGKDVNDPNTYNLTVPTP